MIKLYDPLTWENLMAGVVVRFEDQLRVSFAETEEAQGPGVYALFYNGPHPAYQPISGTRHPIYVGKAVPKGARKGGSNREDQFALRDRFRNHLRSIDAAINLDEADFECRYLAIVPVWVTLAERFLIDHYRPVWNGEVDGFGNNPQGRHRERGTRSWWDTLHPGREWASRRDPKGSEAEAIDLVAKFFQDVPPDLPRQRRD